MSELFLIL